MPCQAAIDLANLAIQADIARDVDKAISLYTRAADELEKAAKTFPDEAAEMRAKAKEYRDRAQVLAQAAQADKIAAMASGAQALQQAGTVAHQGQVAVKTAGGTSTMVGAAAMGGIAGAMLLGPMTAVAAAGAAAYATTRTDTAGDVARSTGVAAATTATSLKKFNDTHDITGKTRDAAVAAAAKAKEVNDKYGITTKAKAAATTAYNKAAEIENKHGVTSKVGGAIAGGLASFTKAMGGSDSKAGAKALPSVPK